MNNDKVTDDTKMPFGKYQGKRMGDVPADYLDWLDGQRWFHGKFPRFAEYIQENRVAINAELQERKPTLFDCD